MLLTLAFYVPHQSIVAGEWIIKGVEPKVFSYAFVLMALSILIRPASSLPLAALLLGIATSFHPLIGLYASFSCCLMFLIKRQWASYSYLSYMKGCLAFLAGSLFAIQPIISHLFDREPVLEKSGELSSSYIYVYLRTPHHLVPASWPPGWQLRMAVLLSVFAGCYLLLRSTRLGNQDQKFLFSLNSIFLFVLSTLIPFGAGIIVSTFDQEGQLLKYYLFRFADVMLPFGACFFGALVIERILRLQKNNLLLMIPAVLACVLAVQTIPGFLTAVDRLQTFPVKSAGISQEWYDLCQWVKAETDPESLFITFPRGAESFPWLARRAFVGTFKQVPLSGGLQNWYDTMNLLGDLKEPWKQSGFHMSLAMQSRYQKHNKEYVEFLLRKFTADYFVTVSSHQLELPVAYRNSRFIVYMSSEVKR